MSPGRLLVRGAGLVAVAAIVAWPSGADAADAVEGGWWWRVQSGQLAAVPPPPGVPEGALLVQGSVDGASAIAAVRYQLAEDETAPVLHLRFAEGGGSESAATAVILACPATTNWRSGGAQPWAEKPVPDCSRQAIGELAEDGASMVFDLSSFVTEPVVDVVLVPGVVEGLPEGVNGSSFTLVFDRPADGDLVTQPAGAPIAVQPAASAPGSTVAAAAPSVGVHSAAPSGGRTASAPSFRPPAAPVAPALPASEVATPGAAPRSPAADASVPAFEPASVEAGDAKALAVVLLVGAVLATVLAGRRDVVLQLLRAGPAAGAGAAGASAPAVAGLGRFARTRDGAPPSLR